MASRPYDILESPFPSVLHAATRCLWSRQGCLNDFERVLVPTLGLGFLFTVQNNPNWPHQT